MVKFGFILNIVKFGFISSKRVLLLFEKIDKNATLINKKTNKKSNFEIYDEQFRMQKYNELKSKKLSAYYGVTTFFLLN